MRDFTTVRMELANAKLLLDDRAYLMERTKIGIEADAIEQAGGVKNLAPNEKAQERVLDTIVGNTDQYQNDRQAWRAAHRMVTLLTAELECIVFAQRQKESALKEQAIIAAVNA